MDFLQKLRKFLHRIRKKESEKCDEKESVLSPSGII